MEDSDSDVAFESADEGEDVKFDQHMINVPGEPHNANLVCLENLKIEESSICDEGDIVKNNEAPLKQPSPNLSQRKFATRKSPSPPPSLQSNGPGDSLSSKEGASGSDRSFTNSTTMEDNKDTNTESSSIVTTSAPPPACKKHRPRVPLRFEKKLQEKNRSSIKKESDRLEKLSQTQMPSPSCQKETPLSSLSPLESGINTPSNISKSTGGSSWGWGSWSSTLLSSAASTVSNLTTQVSQSIETVMETVEASLGVPPAGELAQCLLSEGSSKAVDQEIFYPPEGQVDTDGEDESTQGEVAESHSNSSKDSTSQSHSSFTSQGQVNFPGVSTLTKVLEDKGSLVLQSSLDALEKIGKTTYNILTDGDPGLRKKRSLLTGDSGALLSQALQEARNRPDEVSPTSQSEESTSFSSLLENFHGLAHMEALEALSQVAKASLQDLSPDICPTTAELSQEFPSFEDVPDEEEDHDFEGLLQEHITFLNLPFSPKKLIGTQKRIRKWLETNRADLETGTLVQPKEIFKHGISCLAEMTAYGLEHFHRLGEYLSASILQDDRIEEANNSQMWTKQLILVTRVFCHELGMQALKFSQSINAAGNLSDNTDTVNSLITNLFMEASSGVTYLQDAFYQLVPIVYASLPH